jgi:hypothetical protein
LVILDDHSHFVWTFPLRVKSNTFPTLSKKFVFVSTHFGRTINASSHALFASSGVILQMSCPYTSPQNGKAKHSLHTINNMLHSLLFQASMSARYWVKALHTTTYLLNRFPCKAISAPYPYVTLYGVAPSYEHFCVFDYVCYPNLSTQAAHKLPPSVYSLCLPRILRRSQRLSVSRSLHQQHRHLPTCCF